MNLSEHVLLLPLLLPLLLLPMTSRIQFMNCGGCGQELIMGHAS
jgi:hypothetical protein